MPAPDSILKLVDNFEQHRRAYLSLAYNETQVRLEFIDPFFEALGWDIYNKSGTALAYKDVIHEDALKLGGASTAPDYAFRIGGTRKFFVEAKKPAVNIKDAVDPAYQLRRYAWSAKLPLSILTDFEEFTVYDCRLKPALSDKPSTGRIQLLTYHDYPAHWDEIAAVFSKPAVLKGSFDQYAESVTGKHGTAEVDRAFLAEIERWRDLLAHNIALRNPTLSTRELNYAVQMTVDRIIFLRICEDRGIEGYGQLQSLLNGTNTYERLCQLYRNADDRYDSGLFHFRPEKDQSAEPDGLSLSLSLDDKPIKDIIGNLYYPESPYEFSVLPANILGQVYEQFLGKVIRLTPGHHAVVEDKPEVKKAGGVYYTPTFIVDYIVKHTLGKLLEGKNPGEVGFGRGTPIRVLDMACGSGSFLLGAYQVLLDWYLAGYSLEPEKWSQGRTPQIIQAAHGEWKLTTSERKRILLDHIYGVDIDPQAVEVTKLSLLLKVLEGESQDTVNQQLSFFHQRALPDLGMNIKCGNSLIGPDFYEGKQDSFLDAEEHYRINAFDWKREFAGVFASSGGFDVVIGNPPYRMLQPHNTEVNILRYLRNNYLAAEYKLEMFHMFIQKSITLLSKNGYHGYIVPTTILNNVYAEPLRNWITDKCCVEYISVANEKIFITADVHTAVFIFRHQADEDTRAKNIILTTYKLNEAFLSFNHCYDQTPQSSFLLLPGHIWNILINKKNIYIIQKLLSNSSELGKIAKINRGLITGDRDKYFSDFQVSNKYVPIIAGSDVHRYEVQKFHEYVLFEKPEKAGGSWDRNVHLANHKIVIRQIGLMPMASLIQEPIAVTGNLFTIRTGDINSEKFILGVINSNLIKFYWQIMFTDFKTSFPQVTGFSLSQIPIAISEKAIEIELINLVDCMLSYYVHLASAKTPNEIILIQRHIEITDRQIDALVYKLYGLTEKEIQLIEEVI